MQTHKSEPHKANERYFFCWNIKDHKDIYDVYIWKQEYIRGYAVKCPVCHQYHKVTMRMGDTQ